MHRRTRSQTKDLAVASSSTNGLHNIIETLETGAAANGPSSADNGVIEEEEAGEDAEGEEVGFGIDVDAAPPPPSLKAGAIRHSYSYISPVPKQCLEPGAECILGVDEAGRGPVLGAMVYGVAYCLKEYSEPLRKLGFADSKALTAQKRSGLLALLYSPEESKTTDSTLEAEPIGSAERACDKVGWATRVITPQDISSGMLRSTPYNLNAQSIDSIIDLIAEVLSAGVNVTEIFVDPVGPTGPLHTRLSRQFPGIAFTIEPKADAIYPVVGAASIAAKVTRDWVIERWQFIEDQDKGFSPSAVKLGSGYPSDPRTKEYLGSALDPIFGFTQLVRFSWQTIRTILEGAPGTKGQGKAVKVVWTDDVEEKRKRGGLKRYWSQGSTTVSAGTKRKAEEIGREDCTIKGLCLGPDLGLKWDGGIMTKLPIRSMTSF